MTRTRLIQQAARDHAEEGTEWRDRTERWFKLHRPLLGFTEARLNRLLRSIYKSTRRRKNYTLITTPGFGRWIKEGRA